MPAADPKCPEVNAGELARIFGVSRKWIYRLTEEKGMPKNGRLYDVAECVQWYLQHLKEGVEAEPEDIMEARKRLYVAQTRKTNLEGERLQGKLVDVNEASGLLNRIASIVASQLDAVAPRMAAMVAGETDHRIIQNQLREEHRAVREAIADAIMELPEPGSVDHPPATE